MDMASVVKLTSLTINGVKILRQIRNNNINGEQILSNLDILSEKLSLQISKLDQQVIRNARTAYKFLSDAFSSGNIESKKQSLYAAYKEFSHLVSLEPNGNTEGISNKYLIIWGYLGRFFYFNLIEDINNCLIQVYECTSKYPDISIKLFDNNIFFTENYASRMDYINQEIKTKYDSLSFFSITLNYNNLPDNQLVGLLEIQRDSIIDDIIEECIFMLNELRK